MFFLDKIKNLFVDRTKEQSKKIKKYTPFFAGFFFLIIGFNYLFFSIGALVAGEIFYFIASMTIFTFFAGAFVLLRRGIAIEKIHNSTKYEKYAKVPLVPLKAIAGILISSASAFSAYLGGSSFVVSVLLGGVMLLGWYLYYGFDPKVEKVKIIATGKTSKRVTNLLNEAYKDINTIRQNASRCTSSRVKQMMFKMAIGFEKLVDHIQNEPEDFERVRRYLVSYLSEIRSMSEIYVKLEVKDRAYEMQDSFVDMMQSSIKKLDIRYDNLLEEDIVELDVKLSVMKKRLKNEH